MIFETFLPSALKDGRFVAAPEALDRQLAGVSARKLVVTL